MKHFRLKSRAVPLELNGSAGDKMVGQAREEDEEAGLGAPEIRRYEKRGEKQYGHITVVDIVRNENVLLPLDFEVW